MINAIITEGSRVEGSLTFAGDARIGGNISGSIFSTGELIISQGAKIVADINADVVIISGDVNGNIVATSRVEILRPAQFKGTISSPSLSVEEGVIFHGQTAM